MSIIPTFFSPRISNSLQQSLVLNNLLRIQRQFLLKEEQLSSGTRLVRPSVDPSAAVRALNLQDALEESAQFVRNISLAHSNLSFAESAVADINDVIIQAQSIALGEIGTPATAETRAAQAQQIDALINQLLQVGNRIFNDRYIFGGFSSTEPPLTEQGGGIRYTGADDALAVTIDARTDVGSLVLGDDVFGGLTVKVLGSADLDPDISVDTRLADLNRGRGFSKGAIVISDGINPPDEVDLSDAETIGDVIDIINNSTPGTTTVAVNAAGNGLEITSTLGGADLTVSEVGGNPTATDLGIHRPAPGGGATLTGLDIDPVLSLTTDVGLLAGGAGIDLASGIQITNGANTAIVSFAGAATVEDIINAINESNTFTHARINAQGTGIDVIGELSGVELRIAENGGTTASDLGIRTLTGQTALASLNGGSGVQTATGDDFRITQRDGTTIDVDVSGAATVQDVIDAINTDAENTGDLVASLNAFGNGITLTDTSVDAGFDLAVEALNFSEAAADLGIEGSVPNPTAVLVGQDNNPLQAQGLINSLIHLRTALLADDTNGIISAAESLDGNLERVLSARAMVGARLRQLELTEGRLRDEEIDNTAVLSEEKDLDFTQAIVELNTLETLLEASLRSASRLLDISLLTFLR